MDEIRGRAFLREALELAAVESIARTIVDEQVKQLKRNLRVQQALVDDIDVEGFCASDSEMPNLILGFTNYRHLAAMVETSWLQVIRTRQLAQPNPRRVEDALAEHKTIVSALEARDPDVARQTAKTHMCQLLLNLEVIEMDSSDQFDKT